MAASGYPEMYRGVVFQCLKVLVLNMKIIKDNLF